MERKLGHRLLSMVLSLLMLLSLVPTTVFATGESSESTAVAPSEELVVVTNAANGEGTEPSAAVATIGDIGYATLDAAIEKVKDGDTIVLSARKYKLNGSLNYAGKAFTIQAADGAEVIFDMSAAVALHDAEITFVNVTFEYGTAPYIGIQHAGKLTYTGCTINGMVTLYAGTETFVNCTFTAKKDGNDPQYNVWTYGAKSVEFDGCTFNCDGKAVHAYIEAGNADGAQKIVVNDCMVNATQSGKAFINIKNKERAYDVAFSGTNTVTGLADDSVTGSNLFQVAATDITETSGKPVTVQEKDADGTLKTIFEVKVPSIVKGTKENPYSLAAFGEMTRAEYIKAQEALGGTMYVDVGEYSYDTSGTLGNGVRNDTVGQIPDHSKLNAYGENGYLDERNDGANGKTVVFVGASITSGVTGYASIDNIGTDLLLAVPAYTNVKFEGITFNNVFSFNYQLYTSPWSQLGSLEFDKCTFNGIIVGAIASQTLNFTGCTFTNYKNTVSANNSNPTWIRPAYGNWTKDDNEGQGGNFRSLTTITFKDNTVTSTRPVKFERIAQWKMATTVTATGNEFTMTPQDDDTSPKNVGLYFGANAKFDLIVDDNTKSDDTAALYTAVYNAPNGESYAGLPAGTTVKNADGADVEITDACAWKKTDKITLRTTSEVASVAGAKFATFADAIAAAKDGDTVTLLTDCSGNGVAVKAGTFATKGLTVDFAGHTYTVGGVLVGSAGTGTNAFQLLANNKITFMNGTIAGVSENTKPAEDTPDWHGAPAMVIQNYCDLTLKSMTISGGDETVYTMSNNCGDVVIEDTTINAGKAKGYSYPPFAFDVCGFSSYTGVSVTVKGTSTINGNIEISRSGGNTNQVKLSLDGGAINGTLSIDGSIKSGDATVITKGENVILAAPDGYTWNAEGVLVQVEYVAAVNGKKYESLSSAIAAAEENATVTLLTDTTEDITINKNLTLDLGGKTLTGTSKTGTPTLKIAGGANATVKNGSVIGTANGYYTIQVEKGGVAEFADVTATAGNTGSSMLDNYGTLTITSGTYTGGLDTVKNESEATLNILGGTFTLEKGTSKGFTAVIFNYGQLDIRGGTFIQSDKSAPYGQAQVVHTDKSGNTAPSTKISGGTFKNLCTRSTAWTVRATNAATGCTEVSGGTFNKKISDSYCAEGYIPTKNADGTYGVKEGKYVAKVGSTGYETLEAAIKAAAKGKTVTLLADISGEAVTVDKNLTITGANQTLNNVQITAKGRITLTVTNLKFTGDSYINANGCAALTVEGCEANVTPSMITGRAAFLALGTDETGNGALGLELTVKDSTIIVSKGDNNNGDAYAAAIFGWNYISRAEITGNTLGSKAVPYNFIAVKLMNTTAGADYTISGNTVYGSNESFDFYAFDLYQNTSRANAYSALFADNTLTNTNTAASQNDFYFVDVECNGAGNAKINAKSSNTVNGEPLTATDILVEEDNSCLYAGVDIETNDEGKIIGGTLAENSPLSEIAESYKAIANGNGTHTVKRVVLTVIVKSEPAGAGVVVGNGAYANGETVTITATAVGGYTFLGWYNGDTLVTKDATYTVPAGTTGTVTYTAKYVSNMKLNLTVNVGQGTVTAEYDSVTRTWKTPQKNIPFQQGTYFTLTAKPYEGFEFLYWVDKDNRIVCTEKAYSFYLGDDKTVTAVYREATPDDPYVIVKDMNARILSRGYAYDGVFAVPELLGFEGHTFVGWYDEDNNQYIPNDNGQFTDIKKSVTIIARYEVVAGEYEVTTVVEGTSTTNSYKYGTVVTVTAPTESNGQYFAGWYCDERLVSTTPSYSFVVTANVTLTAKYSETPVSSTPTVSMNMDDRKPSDKDPAKVVIVMDVSWNIPDGYTLVEGGLLRTLEETKKNSLTLGNVDGDTIKKNMTKLTDASGTYSYTLTLGPTSAAKTLYAVGYIICRNNETGEMMTLYTNLCTSVANG